MAVNVSGGRVQPKVCYGQPHLPERQEEFWLVPQDAQDEND